MILRDDRAFLGPKGDYRIPFVFDNLIYRREMPVTIGVFIARATAPKHRHPFRQAGRGDHARHAPPALA